MAFTSLSELTDSQKSEFVAALASIIVASSNSEVTSEALTAVADASGNTLSSSWAGLFASVVSKVGGVDKFCLAPGAGGGGGGGGAAATSGGAAEAVVEEKEEEEEEMDMAGGMDMFGGDEGGGGGDY